ncbi:SufD family Fe-S cluster assembly protein [Cyanobium sp. FGCU-6]|nr:SufD family Fe-S cluster assembly protein [Cyanobium sp. FGCU6]
MVAAPLTTAAAVAAPVHPWVGALLAGLPDPAGLRPESVLAAQAALAAAGLPSRRQEDWRFTDTTPITAVDPRLLEPGAPAPLPPVAEGHQRVVLDGRAESLEGIAWPEGIEPLGDEEAQAVLGRCLGTAAAKESDWPVLVNSAMSPAVLGLRVRGAVAPVLELVSDAGEAQGVLPLRVVLLLEPEARLELLQVHLSGGANLTSVVVGAELTSGAELRHGVVATGAAGSVLLARLAIRQAPGSRWSLATVSRGWGLVRLEPRVVQSEGEAETRLRSLQLVDGQQIADTHSRVRFDGPGGQLEQLHKVVADGQGRSVFNGAVVVPRAAQRTDASQLSRSLLLSDRARVDTKPELEIVADDVRCAHGATVSRLQEDELFYLRSRGIGAAEAARLLLRGYCQEILGELPAAAAIWQAPSFSAGPETP